MLRCFKRGKSRYLLSLASAWTNALTSPTFKAYTFTGSQENTKIPLVQISKIDHEFVTGRIVRLEQFRTINVRTFPA